MEIKHKYNFGDILFDKKAIEESGELQKLKVKSIVVTIFPTKTVVMYKCEVMWDTKETSMFEEELCTPEEAKKLLEEHFQKRLKEFDEVAF